MAVEHGVRLERNKHPLHCFVTAFETYFYLSFLSLEAGIWTQIKTKALWESFEAFYFCCRSFFLF
jgi:hypothetical protein